MKYYFVTLQQQDNGHEHLYKVVAKGKTEAIVRNRIEVEQLYEYGERCHKESVASYFDYETGVDGYHMEEINGDQFITLKRFLSEV